MNIMELFATLSLDSSGFMTAMYGAGSLIVEVGKKLIGFASDSVKTGAEFDTAMSQIAATMGLATSDIENNVNGAGDTFDMLRDKALQMGSSTMYTAQQSAEGLNILAMSGYDAQQSVSMIEDVLHLAAAGSMDLASAAGYVGGAMKGFNDESKNSAYYADLFAKGATLANTSVEQLGDALSSGSSIFSSYDQNAEQAGVALLRLAEQGRTGSEAGTMLSRTMADLYTPTDDAAKALKELGVSAYDSSGKARDVNDVVDDLGKALSGMTTEQKKAYESTIFTSLGMKGFDAMLVTNRSTVNKWRVEMATAAGSATLQYNTMTDNLQGDLTAFGSAMDGLKIAVSDALTGSLRSITQFGTSAVSQLTEAFQSGGISGVSKAFANIVKQGAQSLIENAPALISGAQTIISDLSGALVELAPTLLETGLEVARNLMAGVGDPAEIFNTAINVVGNFVSGLMDKLPDILQTGEQFITSAIDGISAKLPELISSAFTVVSNFVTGLINNLPQILSTGITILSHLVQGILSALPTLLSSAAQLIVQFVSTLVSRLPEIMRTGVSMIVNLLTGIYQKLPDVFTAAGDAVRQIREKFEEIDWLQVGLDVIKGIADGIVSGVAGLVSAAANAAKSLVDGAKNALDIHSPSRVMKNEVGRWIPAGIAEGISDNWHLVDEAMAAVEDMGANVNVNADGLNESRGFTQIVNINQQIDTADEIARRLRIESRYGIMGGMVNV